MNILFLSAKCQDKRQNHSHEKFCLELFRRAIVENSNTAVHQIYVDYYRLVRYWITTSSSINLDDVDDIVQESFVRFFSKYTSEKFNANNGFATVLSFFKKCTLSITFDEQKRIIEQFKHEITLKDDGGESRDVADVSRTDAEVEKIEEINLLDVVWREVMSGCKNEEERVYVELTFKHNAPPRHIVSVRPDLFPDVAHVQRVKVRLMKRLKRNPNLQLMFQKWQELR